MDDVDLVKQKIDIVELINEYVPLKRAGKNLKGLCPFHSEKTPSFMVSSDRQTWHCFGCSIGGDAISFLMQMERLDFPEALRSLASRAGITLSFHPTQKISGIKERLLAINHLAESFYHHLLLNHPSGEKAKAYLVRRTVTIDSMKQFKLGWAPNSWDSTRTFLHKKGFRDAELIAAGLLVEKPDGGGYDRFRGRLIFPLRDHHGNTVGFAGRTLTDETPKYVNTPETAIFTKGDLLYGLDLARQAIRKADRAILVEGELDGILAIQAGTPYVVAVKGTAFTEAQVHLLKRFCGELFLAFDPDVAGSAATQRSIEMAQSAGQTVHIVVLPHGSDPASLIAENKVSEWHTAVQRAQPVYDYWLSTTLERFSLETAAGKQQIASILVPLFLRITDPVTQAHYLQQLAALLRIEEKVLRRIVPSKRPSQPDTGRYLEQRARADAITPDFPDRSRRVAGVAETAREQHFLALLLQGSSIRSEDLSEITKDDFSVDEHRQLFSLIQEAVTQYNNRGGKETTLNTIEAIIPPILAPTVSALTLLEVLPEDDIAGNYRQAVVRARISLLQLKLKAKLRVLSLEMKAAEVQGDSKQARKIEEAIRYTLERFSKLE